MILCISVASVVISPQEGFTLEALGRHLQSKSVCDVTYVHLLAVFSFYYFSALMSIPVLFQISFFLSHCFLDVGTPRKSRHVFDLKKNQAGSLGAEACICRAFDGVVAVGAVAGHLASPLPPLEQLDLPNRTQQKLMTGSIVFTCKQFTRRDGPSLIRSAHEQLRHHFRLDTFHSPPAFAVRTERKSCNF